MYIELYAAWRREIEETSLGGLPPDFYSKIADYMRRLNEENKILEKKSIKVNLLGHESQNVNRMLKELLRVRYKKLVRTITQTQKLPSDLLTADEAEMCKNFVAFSETYQKFARNLMLGQGAKIDIKAEGQASHKRVVLRFVKNIPTIIGADMKTYGPFVAEDVGSLPVENAKMLVKQGLAVSIEVS